MSDSVYCTFAYGIVLDTYLPRDCIILNGKEDYDEDEYDEEYYTSYLVDYYETKYPLAKYPKACFKIEPLFCYDGDSVFLYCNYSALEGFVNYRTDEVEEFLYKRRTKIQEQKDEIVKMLKFLNIEHEKFSWMVNAYYG